MPTTESSRARKRSAAGLLPPLRDADQGAHDGSPRNRYPTEVTFEDIRGVIPHGQNQRRKPSPWRRPWRRRHESARGGSLPQARCCCRWKTCHDRMVKAIQDVSFDIRKSEVRAIIGPNGAGKTSIPNVINGFYHVTRPHHVQGHLAHKHAPYDAAHGGSRAPFRTSRCFAAQRARQHHGGPDAQDAPQFLLADPAHRAGVGRRGRASSPGRRDYRLPWNSGDPQDPGRAPALRTTKRVEPGARQGTDLLLLDEPMAGMNLEERGHVTLHRRRE